MIEPEDSSIEDEEFIELHRRETLKNFWKIIFISLCLTAAALSILFNIYIVLKILDVSRDARGAAEATRIGTARLLDCTTPGGKCYEQGRSATSGAVGTINKGTVATVWCSNHLGTEATLGQLNACVLAIVK